MAATTRSRLVNPRLGIYFGIFAASVVGLFMLLLIFEQLGWARDRIALALLAGPLALFLAIGIAARCSDPLDYFACGRRVPAAYTGLLMGTTVYGATGLVAMTGVLYVVGFDGLCIVIGAVSGFVVTAVLIAPYLRKFGAFTLPGYFGRRLQSRALRVASAAVLSVPLVLMIAAELHLGAFAAAWLTGQSPGMMASLLALTVFAILAAGGVRSQTWSGVAMAIVALLALAVPVAIVAVFATNMPLPQLSHGPVLRALGRAEVAEGIAITLPAPLALALPGAELAAASKRFAKAFGDVGALSFTLTSMTVMAGVASAPWVVPRVVATPTGYEARKALGWAVFFFGVSMLTIASVAVFMRDFVMDFVQAGRGESLPAWIRELAQMGFAQTALPSTQFSISSVALHRDAVLFALPMAAGMPAVLFHAALVGGIAAALAGATATVTALANILAEDVFNGLSWEPPANSARLLVARLGLAVAVLVGLAIATVAPADPLMLLLWSLALSAGTAFPLLVLSIWWKRLNSWGALAGLGAGFAVTVLAILAGEAEVTSVNSALAGVLGVPAAFLAALVTSKLTPAPERHVLELTRDLRMPGGETLFDREMRILRLKQRQRPGD